MSGGAPIFLIPLGRTGGTLMVTMLDAHPDLAMSYEIYQDRLVGADGATLELDRVIAEIAAARPDDADPVRWIKALGDGNLRTFLFRARRAGLEIDDVTAELGAHRDAGGSLATTGDRLDLIERLMIRKMRATGKTRWGGKAFADPRELHRRRPDARFLAMVRDGRDVLASMLNTGDFRTNAERAANEWREHIRGFNAFAATPGVQALSVRYERLVAEPRIVLEEVCAFVGVPYSDEMLRFHEKDMSLFRNPHGHLSHAQIARGMSSESIGRWRRDLAPADVEVFTDIAGDLLRELDYR